MDSESLLNGLAHRLLALIANRTTDLAPSVMEVATDMYSARRQAEELEALFLGRPLVLCLSGSIAAPGSYLAVEFCGTPILLTRDADGVAHAFANACRHRGVRVADGSGRAKKLTCPFHAWAYDLHGRLLHIPEPEAFSGICRDQMGLIELPVAEGYGLVVGRIRPGEPVDIDEYLGPALASELSVFDFGSWPVFSDIHVHEVNANWKVSVDTFRENYHFNYLHRKTLASYAYGATHTFDAFGEHLRNGSALRSIDELRGRPESEWGDVAAHVLPAYALFPNTSLTIDARHIELWQIFPVDESHSQVMHTTYIRPGQSEAENAKYAEMAPWICRTVIDGEDFWVAGRTELNLRAGILGTVVLGRNEPALQHLYRGYEAALRDAR